MLVCNVSLRPVRTAIAAALVEAAAATDAATVSIAFGLLIDEPASASDTLDAFVGQIIVEAASASDAADAGLIHATLVDEPAAATDSSDAAVVGGSTIAADVVETATATDTPDAAVAVTPASYDGLATNVVVSNGNRTVLHNNTTTNSGAISTAFESTGKYYFEVTLEGTQTINNYLGIMSSGWASIFSTSQFTTFSTSVQLSANGNIYSNGASTGKMLGAQAGGDVYSCAIDLTGHLGWFRKNGGNWNGDASADPATGTGGVTIATGSFAPIVRFGLSTFPTDQMTGNFGQAAFVYTAPSGFGTWPA